MADDLLLPAGARLLHIGLAKTGTSSVQGAFDRKRLDALRLGVHYAGRTRQPRAAAAMVATGERVAGMPESSVGEWRDLVREVRDARADRVVISSETFARCDDAAARRVVDAFGAEHLHVVMTARPLADLLASNWQQYVQTGLRAPFDTWLHRVLEPGAKPITPSFWPRTRIDELARRWAGLLGPERVLLVSLAARPRDFVLRTFESLVGLPEGLLEPDPDDANVSLSHPATEVVRHFNRLLAADADSSRDLQARLVEFGALRRLKQGDEPPLHRAPIVTPAWARAAAAAIAEEMTEGVRASGVRVVGDLEALADPGGVPGEEEGRVPDLRPDDAAVLVHAMMHASRAEAARGTDLGWIGTAELARITIARLRDRLTSRARLAIAQRRPGR